MTLRLLIQLSLLGIVAFGCARVCVGSATRTTAVLVFLAAAAIIFTSELLPEKKDSQ